MALILRPPWTRQPQSRPPLNPALRAPVTVWVGSEWGTARLRSEAAASLGTTPPTRIATAQGFVASLSNNNGRIQLAADGDNLFPNASQTTIAILRRCRDTTARDATLAAYDGGGASDRVKIYAPYSDGNLYWDFGTSTLGVGRVSVAFTKTTEWETLVFVAGGGKGREVWRNGTRIVSNTSATASRSSTTAAYCIGAYDASHNADAEDVALLAIASVAWSDAEIRAWSAAPYAQTFAPEARRIWVPVSAGGGASGSSATTNAVDTSSAAGTTTVVGTSARTHADDTSSASGEVGSGASGTSATVNAGDTAAASGTTTIVGSAGPSNANDSVDAYGSGGSLSAVAGDYDDSPVRSPRRYVVRVGDRLLAFAHRHEAEEAAERIETARAAASAAIAKAASKSAQRRARRATGPAIEQAVGELLMAQSVEQVPLAEVQTAASGWDTIEQLIAEATKANDAQAVYDLWQAMQADEEDVAALLEYV